jgi:hypothetical protein
MDESVHWTGLAHPFRWVQPPFANLKGRKRAPLSNRRGAYDPGYLNYTLGKLMIRKLREDWTATRGGRAAWKEFHDAFLTYGGPPIPLVRQAMMAEEAPKAMF